MEITNEKFTESLDALCKEALKNGVSVSWHRHVILRYCTHQWFLATEELPNIHKEVRKIIRKLDYLRCELERSQELAEELLEASDE